MGIHLLHCVHGNKCTRTHDAVRDTFVAIAHDANFHVGQKQLSLNTFNSSHQRVNIMFIKDGIRTLINIVIVDST